MPRILPSDDLLNVLRRGGGTSDNVTTSFSNKGFFDDLRRGISVDEVKRTSLLWPDYKNHHNRYDNFMPNEMIKWKKFENRKKYLRGEYHPNGGELNAGIRSRYPHYKYYKLIRETDEMAKRLGFRNEAELAREIEAAAELCEMSKNGRIIVNKTPKMRNLFFHLTRLKHKSSIVKGALLAGTISGMVIYLAKIQREQSGCFRYNLDNREQLVKNKMAGNFCLGDVHDDSSSTDEFLSKDLIVIPENLHPLFEKDKWNCEFENFEMTGDVDRERVYNITSLGCNGLCNVENFNILASLTNDYKEIINDENEYTFVCERATFLRTLTEESINYISEVADGVIDSNIFKGFYRHIYKYFIFLIILIIVIKIIGSNSTLMKNQWGASIYHEEEKDGGESFIKKI